jgi:chitinase
MKRAWLGVAVVLVSACTSSPKPETPGPKPVPAEEPGAGGAGYLRIADFAEWRIDGRKYLVRDVDSSGAAARLTHLEYSFGDVTADGECVGDADHDYRRRFAAAESVDGVADAAGQPLAGNFNQLRKLKAKHPGLKVVYSIGGWGGSQFFSDAARTAESRRRLVTSCVDRYLRGNLPGLAAGAAAGIFDGIDVDWEWPGSAGERGNVVRAEDKRNFTLLLAEFRRQLDGYQAEAGRALSLSTFVPDDPQRIEAGFEADQIFRYLNYASVNGFDLHGPWDRRTNHQAQLYSPPGDVASERASVDQAVRGWLDLGAPPEKLSVAVSAYGHGWRDVPPTGNGLYQRGMGPAPGSYEPGSEDYRILAKRPGKRFRDDKAGAQWLYDGDQWWSYDDPAVIRQKAEYVRNKGLGGMTLWALDGDDPAGALLKALADGLG